MIVKVCGTPNVYRSGTAAGVVMSGASLKRKYSSPGA